MLEMISLGQGCGDLLGQGLMKEILFPGRKSLCFSACRWMWALKTEFSSCSLSLFFLISSVELYKKESFVKTLPQGLVCTTLAYFQWRAWLRGIISIKFGEQFVERQVIMSDKSVCPTESLWEHHCWLTILREWTHPGFPALLDWFFPLVWLFWNLKSHHRIQIYTNPWTWLLQKPLNFTFFFASFL